jgi:prophage regulatory protein
MVSTILRRPAVSARTGQSRSTIYLQIADGVFPKPVNLGPRSVGWPEAEIDAVNAARIGGMPEADIRALVKSMHDSRRDYLKFLGNLKPVSPQVKGSGVQHG